VAVPTHQALPENPAEELGQVTHSAFFWCAACLDAYAPPLGVTIAQLKRFSTADSDIGTPLKSLFTGVDLATAAGRVFPAGFCMPSVHCVWRLPRERRRPRRRHGCTRGRGLRATPPAWPQISWATRCTPRSAPCIPSRCSRQRSHRIHEATLASTMPRRLSGRGALYPVVDPLINCCSQDSWRPRITSSTTAPRARSASSISRATSLALLRDFNLVAILVKDQVQEFTY
jgi:hypothetical protein